MAFSDIDLTFSKARFEALMILPRFSGHPC